jgi:hypothetical protein
MKSSTSVSNRLQQGAQPSALTSKAKLIYAHALQSASRSVAISQTAQVEAEREDRIRASEAETSSSVEVDRTPHQDQPLVSPSTSSSLAASSNQAAKHSTKQG